MTAAVTVAGLACGYGRRRVLRDVNFTLARGERLGVVGPNGAGKSTLLRVLAGLLPLQAGEVRLGGALLPALSRRALARRVALVPQETGLVFPLTVAEYVALGRAPHLGPFAFPSRRDWEQVEAALRATGTEALARRPVTALSAGERQRVLLARALVQEPEVLLLDEPTSHLDYPHQVRFVTDLLQAVGQRGTAVIWVAHDVNLVSRCVDRLLVLAGGGVVAWGPPAAVLKPAVLARAFDAALRFVPDPEGGEPLVVPAVPARVPQKGEAP